ncbi:MAG: hypothetical protein IKP48_05260 [Bacteroidaceae bacterium]|nr:hypothetical protein [Bacteroidaceae bacterium]
MEEKTFGCVGPVGYISANTAPGFPARSFDIGLACWRMYGVRQSPATCRTYHRW